MTFLISSVYTFLYVAVIIMGGITMTLMLILNIREKDRKHRAVFLFVCSIFIFMILDFITYYFLSERLSYALIHCRGHCLLSADPPSVCRRASI